MNLQQKFRRVENRNPYLSLALHFSFAEKHREFQDEILIQHPV